MQFLLDKKSSIWVAASAGTGKTKITIDRILALLLQDVELNKILAITFTNKAATEMQQRLTAYLAELADYNKLELKNFLREFGLVELANDELALTNLQVRLKNLIEQQNEFRIQTIHSFAQNIIETYSYEAGLRENFTLIDDNYAQQLLAKAREKLYENEEFQPILKELLNEYHDDYVQDILLELINKRTEIQYIFSFYQDFNQYKESLHNFLELDKISTDKNELSNKFRAGIKLDFLNNLAAAISLNGSKADLERLHQLNKLINNLAKITFKDFQNYFCTQKNEFRKKIVSKKVAEQVSNYDENILALDNLYTEYYLKYRQCKSVELAENIALIARLLLAHYKQLKIAENLIDYQDLILLVLALLKDKRYKYNILYHYDLALEHILLDEAQDTSPWQWEIIDLLLEEFFAGKQTSLARGEAKAKSFFIVGDEKQSIYSFQGAEHYLFQQVKQKYKQKLQYLGLHLRELNLEFSYRSTAEILEFVDKFANQPFIRTKLSLEAGPIKHKLTRINEQGEVNLWPKIAYNEALELENYHYADKFSVQKSKYKEQADLIAQDIKLKLADENLALAASDILILTRDRGGIYQEIINSLQEFGLNYQSDQNFALLDKVIIMDLLGFLQFCYDEQDDLNLAAILKSPLFALTEQDIFNLSYYRAEKSLYEFMALNGEYADLLLKLNDLKSKFYILDLQEFYLYILDSLALRVKYYELYGELAEQVILLFFEIVRAFTKRSELKKSFLEFFHSYKITARNEIIRANNLVTLMTMHQSKGLQARVTYVAFSEIEQKPKQSFINIVASYNFIFTRQLALFKQVAAINDFIAENRLSEELRLLYVAFTRARDILELVSFARAGSDKQDMLYDLLSAISNEKKPQLVAKPTEIKVENKPDIIEIKLNDHLANLSKLVINKPDSRVDFSEASNVKNRDIGIIYHDIFNFLTKGGEFQMIERFIEQKHYQLTALEVAAIIADMREIYYNAKFNFLFHAAGASELELRAKLDGELITGRIDRLIFTKQGLEIIDYKYEDGRVIRPEYIMQLRKYANLVRANYQLNIKIEAKIFFIKSKILQTISLS